MKFATFILSFVLTASYTYSNVLRDKTNNTDTSTFLTCDTARRTYRSAGYLEEDIFTIQQTEGNLKVCGKSRTCCKAHAEKNLVKSSEQKRKFITSPLQKVLLETFGHTKDKLIALFRKMITSSRKNQDSMFIKTYGVHYVNNTAVFQLLYTKFHMYLNGSELDLQSSVDTFFSTLNQKMYVVSKPWLSFTKKYENCILESTNYVKPFGDMQRKIQVQVSRSFLASRVFTQGLKVGKEVIEALFNLPVHDGCSIAFMKMTQCSICSGVSESTKPCSNYCVNVLKGCFTYIIMIQGKWNDFIRNMVTLADKLEGPFSFEAAIEPLGLKISEAIMLFQQNQPNITTKVEERCGKLASYNSIGFSRDRRSAESRDTIDGLKTESDELLNKLVGDTSKTIKSKNVPSILSYISEEDKDKKTEFETLLRSTKTALNDLKDYWILLPKKLCDMGISTETNQNCWNGENTTGYNITVIGNSVPDLFSNNPEMKLSPTVANVVIVNQAAKLQDIITRIKDVTGVEPICLNNDDCNPCQGDECDNCVGSGSGCGNGSGMTTPGPGEESGSGEEVSTTATTTKTTADKCINSVDGDCRPDLTEKPDVDLNGIITFVKPVGQQNLQVDAGNYSPVLASNLFLIVCSVILLLL